MHLLHALKEDSALNTVWDIQRQNKSPYKKRLMKSVLNDEFKQEAQLDFLRRNITVGYFLEILRH